MARPRLRLAARGRSTCARGHVERPEPPWGVASAPVRSRRPAGPGWGPRSVAGAASAPRPPAFSPYPWESSYCGRRRRGACCAADSPAARWLRAARDLGRTLPGGVGSREEGVSSHPPGRPRGGPRRGGTHAGRKPVGARPPPVPCPRSQPTRGAGACEMGSAPRQVGV